MTIRLEQNKALPEKSCALFWAESFLWGLMAWRALAEAGLSFDLIRSENIRAGELSRYAMIFVPGGWAQAKVRALGKKGQAEIRRFVENGGSYLGICGGAGLATDSHLGLLPVSRAPNTDRVPSFSGPIRLMLADSPLWKNISTPVFHAWWPPEFYAPDETVFLIPARYDEAGPDAYSADIRVEDGHCAGWAGLEKQYGILLDPARLKGKPAVVEGTYGKGKVVLSLIHFDTPGDPNGARVLQNLWRYFIPGTNLDLRRTPLSGAGYASDCDRRPFLEILKDIQATVGHLIADGERLCLWRRRTDLLLQWRRGVRGMEYSTLAALTKEIVARLSGKAKSDLRQGHFASPPDAAQLRHELEGIKSVLLPFVEKATELLRLEHEATKETVTKSESNPGEKINRLQRDLFGSARHFGGRFKSLIDAIDRLLYDLLKSAE